MSDDGIARESWEITSRGEWLERRRNHVTASRVAALFGVHPFLSRDELAAELRGERNGGDSPAMRAGRILEPAVMAAIIEEHPEWAPSIVKATTYHWLPEFRLGATPDYFWGDDGLIQIKTVSPQEFERWHGTAPLAYVLQTLCELLVTGRTRGLLAIMVRSPSFPLHLREVPRHVAAERRILDAAVAWWLEFDRGRVPEAAPSAEIAADLDDGSHIDLSTDNELPSLLEERARLKATAGDADKRLKAIDDTIRERLGRALTAYVPGWVIRYPSITARAYTVPERVYRRLDVRQQSISESGVGTNRLLYYTSRSC